MTTRRRPPGYFPLLLLCLLGISALPGIAYAQCCTAGNPVNTNSALSNGGEHVLNIGFSYMHSFSDTYYRGTQRLDKTYAESGYDFSALALSYGVSGKLRVTADLGYYYLKSQRFVSSDYTRYAYGISDGTVGLQYSTYKSDDNLFELSQTARVTIPVGKFDQEYDGVVLPIDFQPSSGNFRYNLGLILSKHFEGSRFALMSFGSVEFSQAVETENTYHKYGNLYLASLMGVYPFSASIQGLLQVRYEIRDRALNGTRGSGSASDNRYSYINSSGGVLAYVSPQVSVNFLDDWACSVQYNYPFYKNIYGDEQLTNHYSVLVSLSHALDLGGESRPEDLTSALDMLHTETMRVSGNCDMCKDRIESVAVAQANVRAAKWDKETKKLTLFYADARPDLEAIGKELAKAGHDNDTFTAPDDAYDELPECCHYR